MSERKSKKKSIWSILFLILNIAILYYLVATDEQLQGSVEGFASFHFYILAIALLFMLVYLFIDVVKIYIMLKFYTGRKLPLLSLKISLLGKYYDGITPFAAGGQPFQIYSMTKAGIGAIQSSGVILIKYFMYQAVFFIYGTAALIVNYIVGLDFEPIYFILFIVSLLINFILPFAVFYLATHKHATGKILNFFLNIGVKLRIVKDKETVFHKVHDTVDKFSEAFHILKENKKKMLQLVFLTLLEIAFYILVPFVIYISYHPAILIAPNFLPVLIKFSSKYLFVYFVMTIFPLPGGSGAAEFGFKWLLEPYFLNGTVSIAIIIWRIITYYFPLLTGVVVVIKDTVHKFRIQKQPRN